MKPLFDAIKQAIPTASHIHLDKNIGHISFNAQVEGIDHKLHIDVDAKPYLTSEPIGIAAIVQLCQRTLHEEEFRLILNDRLQAHGVTHIKLQPVRDANTRLNDELKPTSSPIDIEVYTNGKPMPWYLPLESPQKDSFTSLALWLAHYHKLSAEHQAEWANHMIAPIHFDHVLQNLGTIEREAVLNKEYKILNLLQARLKKTYSPIELKSVHADNAQSITVETCRVGHTSLTRLTFALLGLSDSNPEISPVISIDEWLSLHEKATYSERIDLVNNLMKNIDTKAVLPYEKGYSELSQAIAVAQYCYLRYKHPHIYKDEGVVHAEELCSSPHQNRTTY